LIEGLVASGEVVRQGDLLQDPAGTPAAARGLDPRVGELVALVAGAEAQPPTVKELSAQGFPGDAIEAAVTQGALVRLSTEIVMSTAFVDGAREALAALSPITVSAFREAIGTSRKYAVPLLEYFDRKGVTRRDGDVRVYFTFYPYQEWSDLTARRAAIVVPHAGQLSINGYYGSCPKGAITSYEVPPKGREVLEACIAPATHSPFQSACASGELVGPSAMWGQSADHVRFRYPFNSEAS
jgi:hypothetical protein